VTGTFVFEGEGRVQEYVGGFADWVRQRRDRSEKLEGRSEKLEVGSLKSAQARKEPTPGSTRKLSYKEHRELEGLPARIDALEAEQRALNARISGADFYMEGAEAIRTALARVDTLHAELAEAYARWHALEARDSIKRRV
jgi:ATP-binding cassette subfamily F protein uup